MAGRDRGPSWSPFAFHQRLFMNTSSIDTDHIPDEPEHGGAYGLWLRVMYLSVLELQEGRFSTHRAEEFLFDPENIFFDFVAGKLGLGPEGMRERIRKNQHDRSKKNPGRRALRGRCQKITPRDGGRDVKNGDRSTWANFRGSTKEGKEK